MTGLGRAFGLPVSQRRQQADKEPVKVSTLGAGEFRQHLLLLALQQARQLIQSGATRTGESNQVAAPVGRICLPNQQDPLLEGVEHPDQVPRIDADEGTDLLLGGRPEIRHGHEHAELRLGKAAPAESLIEPASRFRAQLGQEEPGARPE
jgi:hypothetical protein